MGVGQQVTGGDKLGHRCESGRGCRTEKRGDCINMQTVKNDASGPVRAGLRVETEVGGRGKEGGRSLPSSVFQLESRGHEWHKLRKPITKL